MLDFEKVFQDYKESNEKDWSHDRNKTVGASEAFDCIRKIALRKRGEEFGYTEDEDTEDSWGAAERGNLIEDYWVVPALDAHLPPDVGLFYAGDDQHTFIDNLNSATPDGLITHLPKDALTKYGIDDIEGDCICCEIKSVDPRVTLDEAKDIHAGQSQVQMGLFHAKTNYRPMYTVILYIDASFLDKVNVFVVKFEPNKYRAAKIRADRIFNTDDLTELAAEGKMTGACKFCTFRYACADISNEAIPDSQNSDLADDTVDEIFEMVKAERYLNKQIKELEDEHDIAKAGLKQKLSEYQTKRVKDDRFSISWNFQNGHKSIDKNAAKADGVDLSKYEKVGPGFEKLTIKLDKND